MVLDTMVFAYALLRVPGFREDSEKAIAEAGEIWVPDSIRAELASVAWRWVREEHVHQRAARNAFNLCDALLNHVVPTNALWHVALEMSLARNHSPYDTLFVALAAREGMKVVTYDARLRERFPEHVVTVREFLRGRR